MHQHQHLEELEPAPRLQQSISEGTAEQDAVHEAVENGELTTECADEHLRLSAVVKRDLTRRSVIIGTLPFLPLAALGAIKSVLPEDAWIRVCTNPVFVLSALFTCVAVPILALKPSRRARDATGDLAQIDDISAIGSLVDTFACGADPRTTAQVREALIRLLPRLRASDAHLLSSRQMGILQSVLKMSAFAGDDLLANPFKKIDPHSRIQLAILKAFEQVGDEVVLSGVQHAVDHGANRDVKLAAAECLPFVQQRVEEAKASKTLLRGSSMRAVDTAVLVRPVGTPHIAPADEMLRQSSSHAIPTDNSTSK